MQCKLVAYHRVSTEKQGKSGLGLEAQEAAVARHVAAYGCHVIASYTEVESGRNNDRAELARAIAHAKRARATLVIAKLDRLARNVAFVSGLMEAGVDFVACDNPQANRLTVHILAAVAEAEARAISERTKAALAAAKARGVKLGSAGRRNLTREGSLKGSAAGSITIRRNKELAYADLLPTIRCLAGKGKSLRAIAAHLNSEGHVTRTGCEWNPMQVSRVLVAARS